MGNKYISPGVYVQERDITIVYPKIKKNYFRKSKISKIFNLGLPEIIVSTPNGLNNFTQQKIW